MKVDYKLIMKILEQMNVPYYRLTVDNEVVGIAFHQPETMKEVWLEYLNTVFRNDGVKINYLSEDEMIKIVIPEEECLIDETHLYSNIGRYMEDAIIMWLT